MTKKDVLYAFTGDLVLQDTHNLQPQYFDSIINICNNSSIRLIVNLESPFIKDNYVTIKNKICLGAESHSIAILKYLSPTLINLSNNHVNDYGNNGIELTNKLLDENCIPSFGIGKPGNIDNIHYTSENIINIAFTLRSADQSGGLLFATDSIDGPSDLDLNLVSDTKRLNPEKHLIVSMHWGVEDIPIPDKKTREIARSIIDSGADVIIGHHPHIIQPVEIYKGKMIFYSLGNFFFPEIKFKFNNVYFTKRPLKHQRIGIIPVFDFSNSVRLVKILEVKNNKSEQVVEELELKKLIKPEAYYQLFPFLHYKNEMIRLCKYYPKRIIEKILICLNLKKN